MYPEQVSLPFGIGSEKEVRQLGPSAWKREMWPRIRRPYKFLEPEAFHLADGLLFRFSLSFSYCAIKLQMISLAGFHTHYPSPHDTFTNLSANHLQQCNVHATTEGPRSNTLQRNPHYIYQWSITKAAKFSDSWGAVSQNRCKHMKCWHYFAFKKVVMWLILLLPLLLWGRERPLSQESLNCIHNNIWKTCTSLSSHLE